MLNHTYTSVKNANLVDCGKKQHISSQPSPLLKDNYLGEFRTELDKKKVLANLGIATDLLLEWEYIKGDVGSSVELMQELASRDANLLNELETRTTYISQLDGVKKSVVNVVQLLEEVFGKDLSGEDTQNDRLDALESTTKTLVETVDEVSYYIENTANVKFETLLEGLQAIADTVNDINSLIKISTKDDNALSLLKAENEEFPGLYVPDLSQSIADNKTQIESINLAVQEVKDSLNDYVTKDDLGGGDFDFVELGVFDDYTKDTNKAISDIKTELNNTVKTGANGHVDNLLVNSLSNDNGENIQISNSFEVTSGIPLDVRCVVNDLPELYNLSYKVCYPGMGVIVKNLDSLYILRNPNEEVVFDQDYISNEHNWKCPEDLVTVPLTRDDYELLVNKNKIDPNVFYYIYEEEFTLTKPPRIEDFDSTEEFEEAYSIWQNQIKELDQQYVSASWGLEIEDLLSKKASMESLNTLKQEVLSIKGDGEGPSLGNLGKSIENLQTGQQELSNKIDTIVNDSDKSGRLNIAETNISNISNSLSNYVTKTELQDESNDFIFVKTSDYTSDKTAFLEGLAESVTTKKLASNSIDTDTLNTDSITLTDTEVSIGNSHLLVDKQPVAFTSELMKVKILTQSDYDDMPESDIEEDVYYYTYEDETPMATKAELQKALDRISKLETDLMLLSQEFNKFIQAQQS